MKRSPALMRGVWLFGGGLLALVLLAAAAPAAFAGSVTFRPARVARGGSVRVKAKPASIGRGIYLGGRRQHRSSDLKLGRIPADKPMAPLTVPQSTRLGKYFVIACTKRGCRSSKKLLTVTRKNQAKRYRYELRYNHSDSRDYTEAESDPYGLVGTVSHRQNFQLASHIKLAGGADGKPATGSGAISYTKASYSEIQTGRFGGQAGPGTCAGTSSAILTSTAPGRASVVGLKIKGSKISLDFRPGPIFSPTPVTPSEQIKYDDDFSDNCYEGHESHERNIYLGDFGNFYDSTGQLTGAETERYVHLDKDWKLNTGSGHLFATLKVRGRLIQSEPSSTYTDIYEIDRFPVK